jgi:dTDP-4-dehydrorhamnose 3,5-epimerase
MAFQIESTHLGEIRVILPEVRGDERGFFVETFRADQFAALDLPAEFAQDNHSRSSKGVLRGLHFQWDPPMGKLMRVTRGAAYLVAVDIRKGSPTLGQWYGTEVSAENKKLIWAPYSFARGFCALTDNCEVQYKCTGIYNPRAEANIRFSDPEIGIRWPVDVNSAIVSERDRNAPSLAEWLRSPLSDNLVYSGAALAGRS